MKKYTFNLRLTKEVPIFEPQALSLLLTTYIQKWQVFLTDALVTPYDPDTYKNNPV